MTFYEQELRGMFADNTITYDNTFCGNTMLGKLDGELRVKLQFASLKLSSCYNGIRAEIISRKNGPVDQQAFLFSDIIGKQKTYIGDMDPHIWEGEGTPEWYLPLSATEKAQIADTILDYVGMYQQEESMEMSEMKM